LWDSDGTPTGQGHYIFVGLDMEPLESAGGNKSEAARRMGITRRTLYKKLKKYEVV